MSDQDYQRIAKTIHYLRATALKQPSLKQIAAQVGLSPHHFQRLFKRFAGVSPKRFLQHLTTEHAKQLLRQSTSVLDTSFAVGLSSPGRLHDLLIHVEAVTPGEYKSGGRGLTINYGRHASPFGECLIATTARGICRLNFIDTDFAAALQALQQAWPDAELRQAAEITAPLAARIFNQQPAAKPLPLLLRGTNFQLKVWQALLQIPLGTITSYGQLAERLEHPGASRAVGTAIGQNPIGYLIPCHRVLRGDGNPGGYRWGIDRKLAILGCEFSKKAAK
jgi:AraC family transcriptional regulator of adaptative response/methylated-DNA-[protein]-cysteine methyltransferase